MSDLLISVSKEDDILPVWRDTPVGDLMRYHNLHIPHRQYSRADILIGMCMDNRKMLRIPDNFAYILRAGGANLGRMEFKVSFAIAIGDIHTICLIGHSDCRMVDLKSRKKMFIEGLVKNGGWTVEDAASHFDKHVIEFDIDNSVNFILKEVLRLRKRYPKAAVAPLFYTVEDGLLYHIRE